MTTPNTPTPTNGDTQTCPTCNGSGSLYNKEADSYYAVCPTCKGTGYVQKGTDATPHVQSKPEMEHVPGDGDTNVGISTRQAEQSEPTPTSGELEGLLTIACDEYHEPPRNFALREGTAAYAQYVLDKRIEAIRKAEARITALIAREKSEYAVRKVRDLEQALLQEKFKVDPGLPEGPFDVVPADVIEGQFDAAIKHEQEKLSRG